MHVAVREDSMIYAVCVCVGIGNVRSCTYPCADISTFVSIAHARCCQDAQLIVNTFEYEFNEVFTIVLILNVYT